MNIDIKWKKEIPLEDASGQNLIYTVGGDVDLKKFNYAGVYMFCRKHGGKLYPLYIGKAARVGERIMQHIKSNVQLMQGIRNSANGKRVLIIGKLFPKQGQNSETVISLVEKSLIENALADGMSLLNVQGTKAYQHTINYSGNIQARRVTGKVMYRR